MGVPGRPVAGSETVERAVTVSWSLCHMEAVSSSKDKLLTALGVVGGQDTACTGSANHFS